MYTSLESPRANALVILRVELADEPFDVVLLGERGLEVAVEYPIPIGLGRTKFTTNLVAGVDGVKVLVGELIGHLRSPLLPLLPLLRRLQPTLPERNP